MAIKPILFNTEMVRAILDGRKSCTRRLVKIRRKDACGFYVTKKSDGTFSGIYEYDENESMFDNPLMPPYQPGDILYVRETWKKAPNGYYYYEDWQRNDIADVSSIAEKHLKIEIRDDKKHNKVSQKQYEKFMDLLKVGESNADSGS